MLNFYHFLSHECVVFLFVFVPLTEILRIQLSGFFAYSFRFLKVLSQLDRIIEEALYFNRPYEKSYILHRKQFVHITNKL